MKQVMRHLCLLLSGFTLTGCTGKTIYNDNYTAAIIIIVCISAIFLYLGIYTNMLRDEVDNCYQFNKNVIKIEKRQKRPLINKENPFSLAKVQLATWTVVIASSYIYLSLCRGDCADASISPTALILMGISAGTATVSAIIDKHDIQNKFARHQNHPSEGFFIDVLSDESGISIHRFQNLVWSVIAIIIYVAKIAHIQSGCELPELNNTLLALTGVSSVTFLAFRSGENKSAESI